MPGGGSGAATATSPAISVMAGRLPSCRCDGWYPEPGALEQPGALPLGVQHVPVEEREHGLIPDPRVLWLRDPVVLVGEVQELRVHPVALEVGPQSKGLRDRHARIELAVDHEHRRLDV